MKRLFLSAAIAVALAGCAAAPQMPDAAPVVTSVDKVVQVECKAPEVDRPAFAFDSLSLGADIYTQAKYLLSDRLQRQGYEWKLEAAIKSCQ